MTAIGVVDALGRALVAELARAASQGAAEPEELRGFADVLGRALQGLSRRPAATPALANDARPPPPPAPGLRHLPHALALARSEPGGALAEPACAAVGLAAWSSHYARSTWSEPFIDDVAAGVLLGPAGPWRADEVILGLFLVGPHTRYPPHAHPAAELYVVLAGRPEFQSGADAPFRRCPAGTILIHGPDVAHAIRTADEPMLALYAWRGDLRGATWYRRDMRDEQEPKRHPGLAP